MIRFHPETLYSLDELRDRLKGTVELATFLERLALRDNRVFRDAVWGWEILDAARSAKPFSEANQGAIVEMAIRRRGGRKRASGVRKFSAKETDL